MLVFYFLAAIAIWLGVLSLRNGFNFARYVQRELAYSSPTFTPLVSIIAPTRGLENGLRENLAALFKQEYPAYEIIFVTDRDDDFSLSVIKETISAASGRPEVTSRIVIAGDAVDCGQKVHNLRVATSEVDQLSEVLVFVDTDARPRSTWLKSLVAPLSDSEIGAASGYRWLVPDGGIASHLASVWNASIASALGERGDRNFCWGGSTAIRKEVFHGLNIREHWRGTVSDDFTMTNVLRKAQRSVRFVPACLVSSPAKYSFAELLEFTNRQLKITRVYAPHLWKPLLLGSLIFCSVFFGGLLLVIIRATLGLSFTLPLILLTVIFLLGAIKSYVRLRAVRLIRAREDQSMLDTAAHVFLWPFASALYLWNTVLAGFSRRIAWRGITYELKSPTEAVIISREKSY